MVEAAERLPWLQHGCQRKAVADALVKPMTSFEIWKRAKPDAEKMELRDVWHLLKEMQQHGDVTCLTGASGNGAVYYWTDAGRERVAQELNRTLLPIPLGISWDRYSFVMRGAVRRAVVKELARPIYNFQIEVTATNLRRQMLDSFPLSLHGLLRTLKHLHEHGIIAAHISKSGRRTYVLTSHGRKIAELLHTESFVSNPF